MSFDFLLQSTTVNEYRSFEFPGSIFKESDLSASMSDASSLLLTSVGPLKALFISNMHIDQIEQASYISNMSVSDTLEEYSTPRNSTLESASYLQKI